MQNKLTMKRRINRRQFFMGGYNPYGQARYGGPPGSYGQNMYSQRAYGQGAYGQGAYGQGAYGDPR